MLSVYTPSLKLLGKPSRRDILRAGFLGFAGLTLPDLLRARAAAARSAGRGKSVIMIWLRGGASHIDSYDMKPEAPAEIRGEFRPIATNVPGIEICEHMPLQAQMMDKLAIIRGIKSNDLGDHTPHYIFTGFPDRGKRPVFGSVVSYLQPRSDGLPPYVSLMYQPPKLYDTEGPTYTGQAHRPFVPKSEGLANLNLAKGVSLDRLRDRRELLQEFDALNRAVEHQGAMPGDGRLHAAGDGDDHLRQDARSVRHVEGIAADARALRQVQREPAVGPAPGRGGRPGRDVEDRRLGYARAQLPRHARAIAAARPGFSCPDHGPVRSGS